MNSQRLLPRVGDNLDRLLDLLERARREQSARAYASWAHDAPYVALIEAIEPKEALAISA